MLESQSLRDRRHTVRKDFIDYTSFLGVSQSISSKPTLTDYSTSAKNYESLYALKETLQSSLRSRLDRDELMGLSASQIGIPAHAVYLEYVYDNSLKNIMLTDPSIVSTKDKNHDLFLKVIKCPNSPSPYHIGLFNRDVIIKSSNNKDFKISTKDKSLDPTGSISANLQRIVWADKGYIPGDITEIPMNYYNICKTMEDSPKLQSAFTCWIRRDEIPIMLDKYKIVDSMGCHRNGTRAIHTNFLNLMVKHYDDEWIKVPPINMFKESSDFILN